MSTLKCSFSTMFAIFISLELIMIYGVGGISVRSTNQFLLRFEDILLSSVEVELLKENITYVKQILPGTFLFRDDGTRSGLPDTLKENKHLSEKVSGFERVQEYIAELWTKSSNIAENDTPSASNQQKSSVSTYFDMGVEGAWRQNYTGKGITIAVTDVGVNKDVEDLKPNINTEASYNAVDEGKSTDVTPEQFDDYPKSMFTTDHGNRCTGMISALRNDICGDGVAYEAQVAVLKIFKAVYNAMDQEYPHGRIRMEYPYMAEGIFHIIPKVDIYSNSWGNVQDFNHHQPRLVVEAIEAGVVKGRGGKGAVHVFPVGHIADPFANSIYTIAVNSAGEGGVVPTFSRTCACTLTTAYGEGCDTAINPNCAINMKTASRRGCTIDFQGTSASTAIVAGILGLALQANPKLGWREVQDIVVRASGRKKGMAEYNNFQLNGAGRYYHPVFGFGLLNATTLVTIAKDMQPLPQQVKIDVVSATPRRTSSDTFEALVNIPCTSDQCVTSIEHVIATITFNTTEVESCNFVLFSPSATHSLLMEKHQTNVTGSQHHVRVEFLSVNFWGEKAFGQWTLVMTQDMTSSAGSFDISEFRLTVFGIGRGTVATEISSPGPTPTPTATQVSTPSQRAASGSITFYFVGIVGLAGVLFVFGFRKMLQNRQDKEIEMEAEALCSERDSDSIHEF